MFVDVVGKEGREHTGHKGKTKVGLESKFNKDEAKKIVSNTLVCHCIAVKNIIAHIVMHK